MKTLYKCFTLLLALGWSQISLANNPPPPPPPPPAVDIVLSGTESGSQVCRNDLFTARAVVTNTSTSGLTYKWLVGRGTVNGSGTTVTTSSNTVNCAVTLPLPLTASQANVVLQVFRGTQQIAADVADLTLLPEITPAQPGGVSITADPPSPTGQAPCQFVGVTFSVASVTGAYQYIWTANGRTTTTSSRIFSTSFSSTGNQTVTVRARGCAGDSPIRSTSVFVIPSNDSPCNDGPFLVASGEVNTSPNPATAAFVLEVPETYVSTTAQLTDQKTGEVVKTFTVTGTKTEVDTQGLPSGVYLLTIPSKDGKITKRIVVQ